MNNRAARLLRKTSDHSKITLKSIKRNYKKLTAEKKGEALKSLRRMMEEAEDITERGVK